MVSRFGFPATTPAKLLKFSCSDRALVLDLFYVRGFGGEFCGDEEINKVLM
jgi:hypothetical protein